EAAGDEVAVGDRAVSDGERPRLQQREIRRVARAHAEQAVGAGRDDLVRLLIDEAPVGRDDLAFELAGHVVPPCANFLAFSTAESSGARTSGSRMREVEASGSAAG